MASISRTTRCSSATFSYSDTQRYRVGPNYLQLPINAPVTAPSTNQQGGQMSYHVDGTGSNPLVNYEPSITGGLPEAQDIGPEHQPWVEGKVGRQHLSRRNDHGQAGERYRTMPDWEREDLILNLTDALSQCDRPVQEAILQHFHRCDPDFGRRVAEVIGVPVRREDEAQSATEIEPQPAGALGS